MGCSDVESSDEDTEKSTQKWPMKCQKQMNLQIKEELTANYTYLSFAQYFERQDVALLNIAKFFYESADEEKEHAQKFIKYQNKRGGTVKFYPLEINDIPKNFGVYHAFKKALALEKHVYEMLLKMHDTAPNDPELQDFIASDFLHEQVESINQLKSYITDIERVTTIQNGTRVEGLGIYLFDKNFGDK